MVFMGGMILVFVIGIVCLVEVVIGYGWLIEFLGRFSMWCYGYRNLLNYNDN